MQPTAETDFTNKPTAAVREDKELALDLAKAYLSRQNVQIDIDNLPKLFKSCLTAVTGDAVAPAEVVELTPAVSIKKSVHPDFIVCLEDGKKFKSLKRHLRTQYNMSPEQYREKWGLPPDYPMVAPNYAEARSQLAKKMGLGQQRRKRR